MDRVILYTIAVVLILSGIVHVRKLIYNYKKRRFYKAMYTMGSNRGVPSSAITKWLKDRS